MGDIRINKAWSLCFFILLGISTAGFASSDSAQQQIEAIQQKQKDLTSVLTTQQSDYLASSKQLRRVEKKISHVLKKLRRHKNKIKLEKGQLAKLNEEKSALKHKTDALKKTVGDYLVSAYMIQDSQLKLILGNQSLAKLDRFMLYRNFLYQDQLQRMEELDVSMRALDELEVATKERIAAIDEAQTAYTNHYSELKKTQSQRRELLAILTSKISSTKSKLDNLKAQEEKLTSLLDQLTASDSQRVVTISGDIRKQKGRLNWPTMGEIRVRYGKNRTSGMSWNGMIVGAPLGSEVKAVFSGKIVFSDWLRGYGLLVIIDHGKGVLSLYGYNESIDRFAGDHVNAGEIIGFSGTDDSNRFGSYFGIRVKGRAVNPMSWLKASNQG